MKAVRRDLTDRLGIIRPQLHASAYWFSGRTMSQTDTQKADRYARAISAGLDPSRPEVLESIEMLEDSPWTTD